MNASKLVARAKELKEAIESGEAETIAAVYTPEERKHIRKHWPLMHEMLDQIDDQINEMLEAQDGLLHNCDILEAVSDYYRMLDRDDRAQPSVEVVDAVVIHGED